MAKLFLQLILHSHQLDSSLLADSCGSLNKNLFLEFLPKDTVRLFNKGAQVWSSLCSTASESQSEKNEEEELIAWVIIFEKELSNNYWETLKFLLKDRKSVGANAVESSDFLKVCTT